MGTEEQVYNRKQKEMSLNHEKAKSEIEESLQWIRSYYG